MKSTYLASLVLLPLCAGCIISIGSGYDSNGHWEGSTYVSEDNRPTQRGSGVEGSSERSVGEFRRVDLKGPMDVELSVGGARAVRVQGDDNLLEHVFTRVEGETLVLGLDSGRYDMRKPLRVLVSVPELDGLVSRGSGDAQVTGLTGESFQYELRGSGDARLVGDVQRLQVSLHGSGDVDASELEAREASVRVHGSGDVVLCAREALEASISGSGDVRYLGTPAATLSVTGSGSIGPR